MRAHAAASAVASHGSTTPPTQAPSPNMATKSLASNCSGVTEPGKFGNAKPSGVGRSVVAIGRDNCGAESVAPPEQPAMMSVVAHTKPDNSARGLRMTLLAIQESELYCDEQGQTQ